MALTHGKTWENTFEKIQNHDGLSDAPCDQCGRRLQKMSALRVTCKENYNIALVFNKYMKLHMFECFSKTPLQYCVFHGKTLTRLKRQIYNGEKLICGH